VESKQSTAAAVISRQPAQMNNGVPRNLAALNWFIELKGNYPSDHFACRKQIQVGQVRWQQTL
jgi:hypothetical protein